MSALLSDPREADGRNLLGWASIGVFTARHVVSFANISGASMQPTFNPDLHKNPLQSDVVLLKRFGFDHGRFDTRKSYRRGDVVTLWCVLAMLAPGAGLTAGPQ